jgi:hypothetical protein
LAFNAALCREVPKNLICLALMRRFAMRLPLFFPGFAMYVSLTAVAIQPPYCEAE